jgi:hypothetical protein
LSVDRGAEIDEHGVRRAGGLVVPRDVTLPWEVAVGMSMQVGARPLNPEWLDPGEHERDLDEAHAARAAPRRQVRERWLATLPAGEARERASRRLLAEERVEAAREQRRRKRDRARLEDERRARAHAWPREHLMLTADLLVTGPVDDGLSLERFLGQAEPGPAARCTVVGSGEEINFSPRFGLEMEPVPMYVHTRFGSYYEPNRFRFAPADCNDRVGRQHFTFGADVKLVSTTWWGLVSEVTSTLQAYGDLAPRYQSFGAGLGVWY